ncbi:hypothetical protein V6N12_033033 [Hibiscus sabdariffa]|uniref:Uncharacterized protein n=1 Tax=Hibiscus sabdariffa TaxID=183260 RepID=A0ABR2CF75_9ROSI
MKKIGENENKKRKKGFYPFIRTGLVHGSSGPEPAHLMTGSATRPSSGWCRPEFGSLDPAPKTGPPQRLRPSLVPIRRGPLDSKPVQQVCQGYPTRPAL